MAATRPLARSTTQVASGVPGSAWRASTSQFSPARRTLKRASGCDEQQRLAVGLPLRDRDRLLLGDIGPCDDGQRDEHEQGGPGRRLDMLIERA